MRDIKRQRALQLGYMRRARQEFLNGKVCVRCGSSERLEVDHIDRTAKARKTDHAVWSWTPLRRTAELAKCQVLCRRCHWEKTKA